MQRLLLLLGTFLILSCGPSEPSQSSLNDIIGRNDRALSSNARMGELVGSLKQNGVMLCTAFVSSPNTIVTANHCYANTPGEGFTFESDLGIFEIAVRGTRAFHELDLVELPVHRMGPSQGRPVFTEYLSFGTGVLASRDHTVYSRSWKDARLLESAALTGLIEKDGFLLHDFDTLPGASGSPIIHNGRVIAVHLGALREL